MDRWTNGNNKGVTMKEIKVLRKLLEKHYPDLPYCDDEVIISVALRHEIESMRGLK